MKKTFEMVGFLALACFSFFYTNKVSTVIKENDSIMLQIEQIVEQYKVDAVDASITETGMIPGLAGKQIDVKESYKKMKKTGSFNVNLLVYETVKPQISIVDKYDKPIISGNKNKKEVSLLFLVDNNDNIDNILSILNKSNIEGTFFIDGYWFEENNQKIVDLSAEKYIIGNLGYKQDYSNQGVSWMNTIITKIVKQKDTYCYTENRISDYCILNRSYTIKPSVIIKEDPLMNVKKNMANGSIISIEVNDVLVRELPSIIEYIHAKDLEIVNIQNLLEE